MATNNRRYNDAFRAHAITLLEANNGNLHRTSRGLAEINDGKDFSRSTLRLWWRQYQDDPDAFLPAKTLDDSREKFLRTAEEIVERASARVLESIDEAKPKDAAWIAAVFIDKARLVAGQPTQITENVASGQVDQELIRQAVAQLALDWAKAIRRAEEIDGEVIENDDIIELKELETPQGEHNL